MTEIHSSSRTPERRTINASKNWLSVLIGLIVVVLIMIGGTALYFVKQNSIHEQGKILSTIANTLAKRLDRIMIERYGDMAVLAQTLSILPENSHFLKLHLQTLKENNKAFAWLGVVNTQGDIIEATISSTIGTNISREPTFLAIQFQKSAYLDEDPTQRKILNDRRALLFGAPIRDKIKSDQESFFKGGIIAYVPIDYLVQEFEIQSSVFKKQFSDISRLEWQLIRRDGLVLVDSILGEAGTANLQKLELTSAHNVFTNPSGYVQELHKRRQVDVLTGFARMKDTTRFRTPDWGILVRQDLDGILTPIRTLQWKIGLVSLLTLTPLILLLVWSRNNLLRSQRLEKESRISAQESESRNRLLLNSVRDGIWGLDLEGKTTFVNPAAARLLGYEPAELIGTLMHATVHHTKSNGTPYPREACPMYAAYLFGKTQTVDHEVLWRKDGTSFPVEYTSTPIRDEQGHVKGAVVTFRNISERIEQQAEIQKLSERLQLATQSAKIGVWDWDIAKNILTWDDQMYALYGRSRDSLSVDYEAWTAVLHPEDHEIAHAAMQDALSGGKPFNTNFRIVWPDHSIHHIRAFAIINRDTIGQAVRMTGVNWDNTEEKIAENALTQTIDKLRRSNSELEQFAYVASHDLQEPLRKIRNYSELLESRTKDHLPPESLKFLSPIVSGAIRMQTLVQDLLTYSRVARGELIVEKVNLQTIANNVLATLEDTIAACHATVTIGELPIVQANPTQMEQLLQNLIGNGLKYRGETSPVIEISATQKHQHWEMVVRDNGIGLDTEYAERIFVIFQRLHTKKEYSGTGIGLAICKKIVELHGGKIWVESTLGEGSTFFFTLLRNPVKTVTQSTASLESRHF